METICGFWSDNILSLLYTWECMNGSGASIITGGRYQSSIFSTGMPIYFFPWCLARLYNTIFLCWGRRFTTPAAVFTPSAHTASIFFRVGKGKVGHKESCSGTQQKGPVMKNKKTHFLSPGLLLILNHLKINLVINLYLLYQPLTPILWWHIISQFCIILAKNDNFA